MLVLAVKEWFSPGLTALYGTIIGTVGLKVIEHWLNKSTDEREERKEFRETVNGMNDRLDKVEAELDAWKAKYYAAQEEILVLKAMMVGAGMYPPDKDLSNKANAR